MAIGWAWSGFDRCAGHCIRHRYSESLVPRILPKRAIPAGGECGHPATWCFPIASHAAFGKRFTASNRLIRLTSLKSQIACPTGGNLRQRNHPSVFGNESGGQGIESGFNVGRQPVGAGDTAFLGDGRSPPSGPDWKYGVSRWRSHPRAAACVQQGPACEKLLQRRAAGAGYAPVFCSYSRPMSSTVTVITRVNPVCDLSYSTFEASCGCA